MATEGLGTTLTFGTSGFASNLLAINGVRINRGQIQTSHMATIKAHDKIPQGLYEWEVDITFEFNGDDSPPIDQDPETITIDYAGQGAGYRQSGSAFMTNYESVAQIGDRMTATATLVGTGALSLAA